MFASALVCKFTEKMWEIIFGIMENIIYANFKDKIWFGKYISYLESYIKSKLRKNFFNIS